MGLYNYGNIAKATGNNAPGICTVYFAPLSYFDTIQKPSAHSTAGQSVTISGTHTFASGKGWIQALGNGVVKSKNTGKGSTTGEQGSKILKTEITAPVAGLNAALLELIDGGLNEEWIVLVEDDCCDSGSPTYRQFGTECKPAMLSADLDFGTIEGGFKGATLKFEAYGTPQVYTGTVTLYS